jgi:cyanate lyase
MKRSRKYMSLTEYRQAHDSKVVDLARALQMSRFRVTALLYPDTYPVTLRDEEVDRLAEMLNQDSDYVREFYRRAAA